MKNPQLFLLGIVLIIVETAFVGCSSLQTVGGSEIGNPTKVTVKGSIVYQGTGAYGAGAVVRLLNKDYCKDTTMAAFAKKNLSSIATFTDEHGGFIFDSVDTGDYTIEANDGKSNGVLISCSIKTSLSTLVLPIDTLRPTSRISGVVSAAQQGNAVYVQIYGLDRVARANASNGRFVLRDVPKGLYSLRVFSSSPAAVPYTLDRVEVGSGDSIDIGTIDLVSFGGWRYSRKLWLNTASTGANIVGNVLEFPVLLRLTGSNFSFGEAMEKGTDVRFAKSNGQPLPFEIERWDPAASGTGGTEIWVKIDTIFGNNSNQFITMYWGASIPILNRDSVAAISNSAAVFDTANGFQGVWHMGEIADTIKDATVNHYDGIRLNSSTSATVSGIMGFAQEFDGVSNYIEMKNTASGKLDFPEHGTYTLSAWVYIETLDSAYYMIATKGNKQYGMKIKNTLEYEFTEYQDSIGWDQTVSPVTTGAWAYAVGVRSGDRQYLYINGECADSAISNLAWTRSYETNGFRDAVSNFTIGKKPGDQPYFFLGRIDEVRASNVARSAEWVKLCYMNQRSDNALIVVK